MKKLFIVLFVLVGLANAATTYFSSDSTIKNFPQRITAKDPNTADRVEFAISDNRVHSQDTIATGAHLVVGPFPLSDGSGAPMYKSFNLVGNTLASGDSLKCDYQLTLTGNIADTSTNWTTFDSLKATASASEAVVDLSTKCGRWAWYRFENYTAGEVVLDDWFYVMFRKNGTYYYRMK
jgi:hypothetical protein